MIIYIYYTYCNHIIHQWSTKHHKLPILCCWTARLRPRGFDLLLRHLGPCQDVAPRSATPERKTLQKMVHSLGPWDVHQEKLTKKIPHGLWIRISGISGIFPWWTKIFWDGTIKKYDQSTKMGVATNKNGGMIDQQWTMKVKNWMLYLFLPTRR